MTRPDAVIFVTIGSMFPFDRMIRAMDAWAADAGQGEEILAQIGDGAFEPRHMTWVRRLDRPDYAAAVARSRLVVAHAGIGSIVSAARAASRSWCCRAGRRSASIPPTTRSRPSPGCTASPGCMSPRPRRDLAGLHRRRGRGRRQAAGWRETADPALHRPPAPLHRGLNAPRFEARARCARKRSPASFRPKH